LPRVDAAADMHVNPPLATGGMETVLLAEDEESLRELIGELLEASGYQVLAAEDPTKAIETAERHGGVIHLLLTDVLMPGMNGRELAQRVRELRPDIRVLYMSGHTEDSIAQSGLLEPGALLISKPFTQESLARKVREALGPRPREQG
jgi:CheY-like chemotaxis protein